MHGLHNLYTTCNCFQARGINRVLLIGKAVVILSVRVSVRCCESVTRVFSNFQRWFSWSCRLHVGLCFVVSLLQQGLQHLYEFYMVLPIPRHDSCHIINKVSDISHILTVFVSTIHHCYWVYIPSGRNVQFSYNKGNYGCMCIMALTFIRMTFESKSIEG